MRSLSTKNPILLPSLLLMLAISLLISAALYSGCWGVGSVPKWCIELSPRGNSAILVHLARGSVRGLKPAKGGCSCRCKFSDSSCLHNLWYSHTPLFGIWSSEIVDSGRAPWSSMIPTFSNAPTAMYTSTFACALIAHPSSLSLCHFSTQGTLRGTQLDNNPQQMFPLASCLEMLKL